MNAPSPKTFRLSGRIRLSIAQPEKASFPIASTPSQSVREERLEQELNALSPTRLTFAGIVTSFREPQLRNAF